MPRSGLADHAFQQRCGFDVWVVWKFAAVAFAVQLCTQMSMIQTSKHDSNDSKNEDPDAYCNKNQLGSYLYAVARTSIIEVVELKTLVQVLLCV